MRFDRQRGHFRSSDGCSRLKLWIGGGIRALVLTSRVTGDLEVVRIVLNRGIEFRDTVIGYTGFYGSPRILRDCNHEYD